MQHIITVDDIHNEFQKYMTGPSVSGFAHQNYQGEPHLEIVHGRKMKGIYLSHFLPSMLTSWGTNSLQFLHFCHFLMTTAQKSGSHALYVMSHQIQKCVYRTVTSTARVLTKRIRGVHENLRWYTRVVSNTHHPERQWWWKLFPVYRTWSKNLSILLETKDELIYMMYMHHLILPYRLACRSRAEKRIERLMTELWVEVYTEHLGKGPEWKCFCLMWISTRGHIMQRRHPIIRGIRWPILFTGRTNFKSETPVFWSSYASRWLIGKVPDVGKDLRAKEKRASEDEMARWQHQYNDHELGQTSGNDEEQGGLSRVVQGSCKETDTTGWLNNDNQVNKMTHPLGMDQSFLSYLVFIQ